MTILIRTISKISFNKSGNNKIANNRNWGREEVKHSLGCVLPERSEDGAKFILRFGV